MLCDIRRLTGANFLMAETGAAADAMIDEAQKPVFMGFWRKEARALLDAVGWTDEKIAMRAFDGGVTLQISAPADALYAATEIVESAWAAAEARLKGTSGPDLETEASRLRTTISAESNPVEIALTAEAEARGVTFLSDDEHVSVGLGTGAQVWPAGTAPPPDQVDWEQAHDIPVALVTGTNGKSTTVRLAAAIGQAAGFCVGLSSSDWVRVGGEIIDEGDYSGPAGARLAVRDPRVELAMIETARGGLMRRGLPLPRADVCLLTNIAADHLGTYGITDVQALADAKFQIADAVRSSGRLILNADDPELVNRSAGFFGSITWFGLTLDTSALEVWIADGGHAVFVADGQMVLARDGMRIPVLAIADFQPAMGGAAKYNISNALGAIGLADALGLPVDAMTLGLAGFADTPQENPGRGNFIKLGGVTLMIDYAHNPHGITALAEAVRDIPAQRRLFLAGQAGDRSDEDLRAMTGAIWKAAPDMVIIKELPHMLRGRALGEVPELIAEEFTRLGAGPEMTGMAKDEFEAVQMALNWARPGDFLVLLLHEDRMPAMELIERLKVSGWQAGDPV